MSNILDDVIDLSRSFGSDPRYVLAGGGNSSFKQDGVLYVKPSGSRMSSVSAEDFVAVDLGALQRIWEKEYPAEADLREDAVLADLMSARLPGEERKRPSVETLLHSLFTDSYVLHTHPALVNGLTCSVLGEEKTRELFGPDALWIPVIEPGYILAKAVRDAMRSAGRQASLVFLQNHGVFISGESRERIEERYDALFAALKAEVKQEPVPGRLPVHGVEELKESLRMAFAAAGNDEVHLLPFMDKLLMPFIQDRSAFSIFESPFTPDHIVYAGFRPLFLENLSGAERVLASYAESFGELPKIIALRGIGCFACTAGERSSADARDLFMDAAAIAVYSSSFGGPLPMPERLVSFIRNWEAEKYRQKKD